MSEGSPLEIKVVYDASGKRSGRRHTVAVRPAKKAKGAKAEQPESESQPLDERIEIGKPAEDQPVKVKRTTARRTKSRVVQQAHSTNRRGLVMLGLWSLLVTAGLIYGIWWQVDKYFIAPTLILETPVEGINLDGFAGVFGAAPPMDPSGDAGQPPQEPATLDADERNPMFTGTMARNLIIGGAYGWETVSTIGCLLLALAAGAGIGRAGGRISCRIGLVLAIGVVATLAWLGFAEWTKYREAYPPNHLRIGMACLAGLSFLIGVSIGRATKRLYKIAGIGLLFSATASVVGLCIGSLCGAIDQQYLEPKWLGMVFMVHSLWAWMIFIFGLRIAR